MKAFNFDIVKLRWVFLVLYLLILAAWIRSAWTQGNVSGVVPYLLVILLTQTIFLFCSGGANLCQPIRKRWAFLPVVITGALMTILFLAAWMGLAEFIHGNDFESDFVKLIQYLIAINWIGWSVAFLLTHTADTRYTFIRKQVLFLMGVSLLQLMILIPACIVTSQRDYFLAGLATMVGIMGGLAVLLWALGPGIALLFLKHKQKA